MSAIPTTQKFHTVASTVDTIDYGSEKLASGRKVYTMQDIIDTVGGGGGAVPFKSYVVKFNKQLIDPYLYLTDIYNDTGYTFSWVVNGSSINITSSGVIEGGNINSTYSLPSDASPTYNGTSKIMGAFIQTNTISISAVQLNMSTGVYTQMNSYGGIFELRVYGIV